MDSYLIVIVGVGYLTRALTWSADRSQAAAWDAAGKDEMTSRYPQAFACPA